ncbi:MAG: hypothetical protein Q4G30_05180 [Actinomycetaceae bacterium]|nr:hypothetical protein [Actinomycetaceae bacterium]
MPSRRPRGKRPYGQEHIPLDRQRLSSIPQDELGPDGQEYSVSRVSGSAKPYTCPACLRPIPAGTAHVVAWRNTGGFGVDTGVDARRHWHTACWNRGLRPL